MKHFLKTTDFHGPELEAVFNLANSFKTVRGETTLSHLDKQSWGMLFFKSSFYGQIVTMSADHALNVVGSKHNIIPIKVSDINRIKTTECS